MRLERALYGHLSTLLAIGAAVLALNIVLYFTAVSKLDRYSKSVKARVSDNRSKLLALEAKDRAAAAGVAIVENNRQVVTDLADKILLTKGQRLVEVQNLLRGFVDANRLQMDRLAYSYTFLPAEKGAVGAHRYLKVDIGMPVIGTYPDIKGFMKDVQISPQFLSITAVNLTQSAQGSALIQGNFTVTTYFIATAADESELAGGKT
jgi:Tfp pilus assembly protein PilO